MTEWGVVGVIVTLIGLVAAVAEEDVHRAAHRMAGMALQI